MHWPAKPSEAVRSLRWPCRCSPGQSVLRAGPRVCTSRQTCPPPPARRPEKPGAEAQRGSSFINTDRGNRPRVQPGAALDTGMPQVWIMEGLAFHRISLRPPMQGHASRLPGTAAPARNQQWPKDRRSAFHRISLCLPSRVHKPAPGNHRRVLPSQAFTVHDPPKGRVRKRWLRDAARAEAG